MPNASPAVRWAAKLPRPTRSAAILFGFAIILELLGRLVDSTAITLAAAAALGAVLGDAALTPSLEGVTLTRGSPSRATVGVPIKVRLVLEAGAKRHTQLPPILINEEDASLAPVQILTTAVPRGTGMVFTYDATPTQRGYWPKLGNVTLEAHSPLGGFVRKSRLILPSQRWVRPAAAAPVRLPETDFTTATGVTGSGRTGAGAEFYGIREWRSGDSAASVHWRASARRNQLVVIERERPANPALLILVGPASPGPEWELAVARAAATAVAAIKSGRSATLICGTDSATPDTVNHALDWFAAIGETHPADQDTMRTVLRQSGPGATVLWLASTDVPSGVTAMTRAASAAVVSIRAAAPSMWADAAPPGVDAAARSHR